MVYELCDPRAAAPLFAGWEETLVLSCLEQVMGKIYVTDPDHPKSAMAFLGQFAFYAGEPDRALVMEKPEGLVIMVPSNEQWAALIEECFPDIPREIRYAIKKDTKFDPKKLERLIAALPAGYELRKIDGAIYDLCMESELFIDCVMHFGSKENYFSLGRGFAALKDGKLASVASSFSVYREGIEIEIDTVEEERRKGLASAVAAALILDCLKDGLYPSWDAANAESVHLAEKLGYEFSHEYPCYWVSGIFDSVIPNPDRSGWDALAGRYERQTDDRRIFDVSYTDGDLYVKADAEGKPQERKLYPIGENTFGVLWGDDRVVFCDGGMTVNGQRCRKL